LPTVCFGACATYALVRGDGTVTHESAKAALDLLDVDRFGLDEIDQKSC
jgi:Holliday junction DNA helicase RuvB